MKPVVKYNIELCNCWDDLRDKVVVPYHRDSDGWVRCSECETIPYEITRPIKSNIRIEITAYNTDHPEYRVHKVVLNAE